MLGDGETYIIHKRYYDINGYLTSSVEIGRSTNYNEMRARHKELNNNPEKLVAKHLKYTLDIGKVRFGEGIYE